MINIKKLIEQLSTLNLIVFFAGFDLVTSLASLFLSDIAEHSQLVTIPFRAFSLLLSIIVLVLNLKNKINTNLSILCLFFYLSLLIIRLLYDFGLRTDIDTFRSDRTQVVLLFSSMIINTLATAKSYKNINFTLVFKYILLLYSIILVINFITVQEFTLESALIQTQVSAGLRNTIATGYIAATFILISLFYYTKGINLSVYKLILIPVIIIAIIILLRAGSRGPLLSVFIGIIIYFAFRNRNPLKIIIYSVLLLALAVLFYEDIISSIIKVSPIMADRIEFTLAEGDKLRMEYFNAGIEGFLNNPFTGSYAFVYTPFEWYEYPHQLVIESFMATGILGGIALIIVLFGVIKIIIINIQNKTPNLWIELIAITYVVRALTAGSIYFGEYPIIFILILLAQSKNITYR